jgi:phage replication O-like protein O
VANPQIEEGHLDLANKIVEALARIRLSGEEGQVLWVILRKTYGWHKKEDRIALSQFTQATGINKQGVHRALNKLSSKKIIVVIKKDYENINSYCFNKDFDKWIPSSKKITWSSKLIKGVIKIDKRVSSKKMNTKETITKETITKEKHLDFVFLSSDQYKKLIDKFGEEKTKDWIEALNLHLGSKGSKKYKDHYFTILNWDRMEKEKNRGKEGNIDAWMRQRSESQ